MKLDEEAVTLLWSYVQNIIHSINMMMIPFLKLFGVEEDNSLSPFTVDSNDPSELAGLIEDFFRLPRKIQEIRHPRESKLLMKLMTVTSNQMILSQSLWRQLQPETTTHTEMGKILKT